MSAIKMPRYHNPGNYSSTTEFETALVKAWIDYAKTYMMQGSNNLLVMLEKPQIEYWAVIIDEITEAGWVLRDKEWDISDGDWYGMFRRPDASAPDFAGKIETKSGALTAVLREKAEQVVAERESHSGS